MKQRRANTKFLKTRSLRGEVNASKKRAENLKRLKEEEKEKINDPVVFKEDGEEIKLLRAERPLRRRSEEVVKMQDRLQMSPFAAMFRGKLLGKERDKGNRGGER